MPAPLPAAARRFVLPALPLAVLLAAGGLVASGAGGELPARARPAVAGPGGQAWSADPGDGAVDVLRVGRGERLLVVAPHPDDEVLGAGGLAQRVASRGGTVRVLLLTAGDGYVDAVRHETGRARPPAREFIAYGERRLAEARAAARALGPRVSVEVLGFPDGGLHALLHRHARRGAPMRSPTTGASDPPYDHDAREPDLPYAGGDLRRAMARAIGEANPSIVAIPDPADVHLDHRAAAIFSLLALADVAADSRRAGPRPRVLTYLVHWPAWPPGWDRPPRPGDGHLPLAPPPDLPRRALASRRLALSGEEVETKRAALAAHATQVEVMPEFLGAFVRSEEVFGEVPNVSGDGLRAFVGRVGAPEGSATLARSSSSVGAAP